MQELLFIPGVLLVALVSIDVLHTTIHVGGSGVLTRRFSLLLWRLLPKRGRAVTLGGPVILIASVVIWFLLFWLGWCLIFAASDTSVVTDPDKTPADLVSLIYFVGFSIITLGVGDYAPGGPIWQILTVLAAASGFFIVTLVITYLLPLVSAVVEQRQLAGYIQSLGPRPESILERSWSGTDYSALTSHLTNLIPLIHRQTYQHLAYPILHYFRSAHRQSGFAPAVATLDELLTLLLYEVDHRQRPDKLALEALRHAVTELLKTLETAYVTAAEDTPPAPAPVGKGQVVLPDEVQVRRRLLLGWLRDQGWSWQPDLPDEAFRQRGIG